MARSIPELSVDTQTIALLLLSVPPAGEIDYASMSAAIGRDVQTRARHILNSAVRRVLREKQMVFAPVIGKGLKRLDDIGVLGVGTAAIASIGRKSRRAVKKLACANYDALKPPERVQRNVMASQFGMLTHITSASTQKKLEARAGHEMLPLAKMLAAVLSTL